MLNEIMPWLEVVQTVGAFVSAIAWLAIALISVRLLPQLRHIAQNVEEFAVAGPLNTTFSFKLRRSASRLALATEEKLGSEKTNGDFRAKVERDLRRELNPEIVHRLAGTKVLWVDDRPNLNQREEGALRDLGLEISRSTDTEDALKKLSEERFDLIISDMGRPSGPQAGYDLLRALRSKSDLTPFIIYSTSDRGEHLDEALRAGAQGSTNDPRTLLKYILHELGGDS